jgi:isocitrate dehydrogenase (NAD+)
VSSIRRNKVALNGPISTPVGRDFQSATATLRKALDLYACIRPVRSIPGIPSRFEVPARSEDVNLILVRENQEGFATGLDVRGAPEPAPRLKLRSEEACTRIARCAFELAARQGRKKLTAIPKANFTKLGAGVFLDCTRKMARQYPAIAYDEMINPDCALQLVRNPTRFDVLLLETFFGDIISDLCVGLVGGLGVAPGRYVGDDCAIFAAVHGSAPDLAGKRTANPAAVILSAAEMLRHLGDDEAADAVTRAVHAALANPETRTGDLGGHATLDRTTDAIIAHLS